MSLIGLSRKWRDVRLVCAMRAEADIDPGALHWRSVSVGAIVHLGARPCTHAKWSGSDGSSAWCQWKVSVPRSVSITILLTACGAWSVVFGISSFGFVAWPLEVGDHRSPPLRLPSAFGGRWGTCVARWRSDLIPRKFLQRRRHVLGCRLAVSSSNRPRGVSGDRVVNAFADAATLRDLFKGVSPRMVWLNFWVRDTEPAHPTCKPFSRPHRRWPFGPHRVFLCLVAVVALRIEQRSLTPSLDELDETLFNQMLMYRYCASFTCLD